MVGVPGAEFIALDVETANQSRGSICAVGFAIVRSGQVVDNHALLCRPPRGLEHFAPVNIGIHGITPRMVAGAPSFAECLQVFLLLARDLPVVCHNAAFDINAVRQACAAEQRPWPTLDYGCTLTWARQALPDLPNHKLPTVASACGAQMGRHHEAAADALAAARIMLALMASYGTGSLREHAEVTGTPLGRLAAGDRQPAPAPRTRSYGRPAWPGTTSAPPTPDPAAPRNHPLFGHTVVLTGDIGDLSREEVWAQLAAVGASPKANVTRKTTVLAVGPCASQLRPAGKTQKQVRAEQLAAQGQPLTIVTGEQLLALLAGRGRL